MECWTRGFILTSDLSSETNKDQKPTFDSLWTFSDDRFSALSCFDSVTKFQPRETGSSEKAIILRMPLQMLFHRSAFLDPNSNKSNLPRSHLHELKLIRWNCLKPDWSVTKAAIIATYVRMAWHVRTTHPAFPGLNPTVGKNEPRQKIYFYNNSLKSHCNNFHEALLFNEKTTLLQRK